MKAFSKRAISLILAICVVLTAMVTTFSVFADEPSAVAQSTVYTVTYGSPAIPMYENHKLNLSNVEVQFTNGGTAVNGAKINWEIIDGDFLAYNAGANVLSAFGTGIATLKATDKATNTTRNIYVVVEENGATEFVLFDHSFNTFDKTQWYAVEYAVEYGANEDVTNLDMDAVYGSTVADYKIIDRTSAGCLFLKGNTFIFPKDEILKSFADYTVFADVKLQAGGNIQGPVIAGRVGFDENGSVNTTQYSVWGALLYYGKKFTGRNIDNSYFASEVYTYEDAQTPADVFNNTTDRHIITAKFDQNNFVYSHSGVEIYDISKAEQANKNDWNAKLADQPGAPGIGGYGLGDRYVWAYGLKVILNADANNMPQQEEIKIYTVGYGTPAIPMYKNHRLNLDEVAVEFANGDSAVSGANITWAVADDGGFASYDSITNELSVFGTGIATLTATNKNNTSETKNIYVVANEKGNTEFNIFELDFAADGATFDRTQWTAFEYSGQSPSATAIDLNATASTTSGYDETHILDRVSSADCVGIKGNNTALVLKNDIVSDFADYTVAANIRLNIASGDDFAYRGGGIAGRVALTDAGVIDQSQYSVWGAFTQFGKATTIRSGVANAKYLAVNESTYSGEALTDVFISTDANPQREIKAVFSGDSFAYYREGYEIYDISKANSSFTGNWSSQKADKPGTVGFFAWDSNAAAILWIHSLKVTLNVDANNLPQQKEMELFSVDYNSPAIPMYKAKRAGLNNIMVQLEANGEYILGSKLTWTAIDGTSAQYDAENNCLNAYDLGVTAFNVTDGNANKTVYVIVNEEGNTEFNILDYDFATDSFVSSEWQVFNYPTSGDISTRIPTKVDNTDEAYFKDRTDVGCLHLKNNAALLSTSPMVQDFYDYTVSVVVRATASSGFTGVGIAGHVPMKADGSVDTTKHSVWGAFLNGGTDVILRKGSSYNWWAGAAGSAIHSYTTTTPGDNWTNLYSSLDAGDLDTLTATFDGSDVIYSANGYEIFNSANADDTFKTNWSNAKAEQNGTVGITLYSIQNVFVHKFKVTVHNDGVPTMEDIPIDTVDALIFVPNQVYNLAESQIRIDGQKVSCADVNFDNVRTVTGEVSNGYFVAFATGTVETTVRYNGETETVTLTVDETTNVGNPVYIADSSIAITPVLDSKTDAIYNATVTAPEGKELAPVGLNVTDNGNDVSAYENTNAVGDTFKIETFGIENVKITASFIDEGEIAVAPLGATIRPAAENVETGIKFGNRTNVIENSALVATGKLNGGDITIEEVGTLVIPTALLSGENTILNAEHPEAAKSIAKKLYESTDAFSDYTAVLIDIPEIMYTTNITARGYIAYTTAGDETVKYVYGEAIERSYNQVYDMAEPARNATGKIMVETVMDGGTNHYLDGIDTTDDLSYEVGETITYSLKAKGNYTIGYKLYKDDPEDNLYGSESLTTGITDSVGNKCLKMVAQHKGVLKFSTRMNKPGTIKLEIFVYKADGSVVANYTHTVAVGTSQITAYDNAPADMETKYDAWVTEWNTMADNVAAEAEGTEFQDFIKNATVGTEYNGTLIRAKREANIGGGGVMKKFNVQVATTDPTTIILESTGLNATDISDILATENGFDYNDNTVRPASFNIIVHQDATDNSLPFLADFPGYENAATAKETFNASYVYVNTNPHGIDNNRATAYYTAIHSLDTNAGGTKNYGFDNNPQLSLKTVSTANQDLAPEELYFYGIVKRNYFAMQFAKCMPQYNGDGNNKVRGGSMGAWQSISAGVTETTVKEVDAFFPWMVTVGEENNNKVVSTFIPSYSPALRYFNVPYITALYDADKYINFGACGLGDTTSMPSGIIAAFNNASCRATLEFDQYKGHSDIKTNQRITIIRQK